MKIPQLYFGIAALLLIAGCAPPATPRSYVGTTKDTDWPYRYTLSQTNGAWAGTIERRGTNGWAFWDTMEIVEQQEHRIKFKARLGDTASFRPGWYLMWEKISPQGFSGMLTGDIFDSRMIELSFAPAVTEPDGAANRGQPVSSETNRTSAAAGPGG